MKEEAQIIAIAEACGWTGIYTHTKDAIGYGTLRGLNPRALRGHSNIQLLPDYLNDLNAMHQAEKELIGRNLFQDYWPILEHVVGKEPDGIGRATGLAIHATASQKAEAFLWTIGKLEVEG